MSDSPARILRLIEHWDFSDLKGDMIAVINVKKLLVMKVLFDGTTTLAERLDIFDALAVFPLPVLVGSIMVIAHIIA